MEIAVDRFIDELATRTIENYDYIKNNCKNEGLYEVTQLINSLYCLIVVPEEIFGNKPVAGKPILNTEFASYEKRLKKYSPYHELAELISKLGEKNRIKYASIDEYSADSPVSCFLYHMRNALCHDGIGFLPITNEKNKNEISDIIFRTKSMTSNNVTFMAVLSVEQLEAIARIIASFYSIVENGKSTADKERYTKFYREIEKELKAFIGEYN